MKKIQSTLSTDGEVFRCQFSEIHLGDTIVDLIEELQSPYRERYIVDHYDYYIVVRQNEDKAFTKKEFHWLDRMIQQRLCEERMNVDCAIVREDGETFVSQVEEKNFDHLILRLIDCLEALIYECEGKRVVFESFFTLYYLNDQYCLENLEGELLFSIEVTEDVFSEFKDYLLENKYLWSCDC